MFSNHLFDNHLVKAGLAAAFAIGLTACSSSSDDPPPADDTPPAETMAPEPEPSTPGDLETTQAAAMAAAAAAKAASDAAGVAADGAAAATANSADLQTNEMAVMYAMGARESAAEAMAAYTRAKAASEAAAAATTASAAGRALENAEAAQTAAETARDAATTAMMKAAEAAAMELMIDGTMKMVGDSSIDADMGMLTRTADDDSKTITGHLSDVERENVNAVTGRVHSAAGVTPVVPYRQAVEGRDLAIGKTLDTTDDKARLTLINSRAGSKMVRVYAMEAVTDNFAIRTDSDGDKVRGTVTGGTFTAGSAAEGADPGLKSVGMYYRATESTETGTDGETYTYTAPTVNPLTPVDNELDPSDLVQAMTKGTEVFSYVDLGDDNAVGGTGTAADTTRYVVETSRTVAGGNTDVVYQHVDTMASAAPDGPDGDAALDVVAVKATIPMAMKYSHIHFGIWAGLGDAEKDGSQKLADLGIGFVQNFSDSGVTDKQGIGTATFNGDWVAVVQRQNSAAAGAFNLYDGGATLTADFGKDKFTAVLTGLATLEGALDGNGFSGMTAKAVSHSDLDADGTFKGGFSGNIYGPDGDEAAGVFDFAGGEAGSFRGAFGGTSKP